MAGKKYALAIGYLRQAYAIAGSDQSMRGQCQSLGRQIDRAGQQMFTEADKQYAAGEYLEAVKSYQHVAATFSGLPSSKRARAKLAEAKKDPEVAAVLAEVEAAKLFAPIQKKIEAMRKSLARPAKPFAEANVANPTEAPSAQKSAELPAEAVVVKMPPRDQAEIVRCLETIVKKYKDTPTGQKKADPMLKRLRADETIMASIEKWKTNEVIRQLFVKGKMYQAAGLYQKAADCYQELLKKYPRSEYAGQARKMLTAMKGELMTAVPAR